MRPLEAQDLNSLWKAASDPLIWSQHPDPGRGTKAGFEAFFETVLKTKGCLVAVDNAPQTVIGCSRYSNYIRGQSITIGYTFLSRSFWGKGTNAEMKRLMLRHAFTDVQVVQFAVAERNYRSRRAVEKLGAVIVGAEEVPRWGQVHHIYGLTFEAWTRDAAPGYGPEPF